MYPIFYLLKGDYILMVYYDILDIRGVISPLHEVQGTCLPSDQTHCSFDGL